MKFKFPNIDSESFVKLKDQIHKIPLFLYILRHTFWRPRDILFYYAAILASSKDYKQRKLDLTTEGIRKIVKEHTYKVIETEF